MAAAADPFASVPHCQKRVSSSISPQQFDEETRHILDNFLRRHLADQIQPGSSYLSSGSVASDGLGSEIFVLGAPSVALRKRKVSPWHHTPTYSAVEFGAYEQGSTYQAVTLRITEATDAKPERVSSSASSQNSSSQHSKEIEPRHSRGFDAEPSSSSSGKGGGERLRQKKSAFKRATERLRRSITRSTPVPDSTKRRVDLRSRNSISPTNRNRVVSLAMPDFRRSTSVGGGQQPTANPKQLPKRRRFLERLRSLGRSAKQEIPLPVSGEVSHQLPKRRRPRDLSKKFGDSLTALRDLIGVSPRTRKKEFDENEENNLPEINLMEASMVSVNVQSPSTTGASHDNSNIGHQPMTPSTFFATLSLVADAHQSSSQMSSQQSRQDSSDSDVYAQIAARLGQLGDEYVFGAIEAARMQREEVAVCSLYRQSEQLTPLERDILTWVESTSGLDVDHPEGLDELTQASNANEFGMAIDRAVRRRSGAPATQLALVFHFTSAAIKAVGATSAAARTLGDYCVSYVGNKFADWLIDHGGWLSVVEDPSTSCSEID